MVVIIFEEKFSSSFRAAAISFRVFSASGAASITAAISSFTYDLVAITVVSTDNVRVFASSS